MPHIFLSTNSQDIVSGKSKLKDNTLEKKKIKDICQYIHTSLEEYTKNLKVFSEKGEIREFVLTYYVCMSHVNQIKFKKRIKYIFQYLLILEQNRFSCSFFLYVRSETL